MGCECADLSSRVGQFCRLSRERLDPRARKRDRRLNMPIKQSVYRLADEPRATILIACSKCDWKAAYGRSELIASQARSIRCRACSMNWRSQDAPAVPALVLAPHCECASPCMRSCNSRLRIEDDIPAPHQRGHGGKAPVEGMPKGKEIARKRQMPVTGRYCLLTFCQ